jgi:hypothetical protein
MSEDCKSCRMVLVAIDTDLSEDSVVPGSFYWSANVSPPYRTLRFKDPNGGVGQVALHPLPAGAQKRDEAGVLRPAAWTVMVGDVDAPTLTPAISRGAPGDADYWHGHFVKGEMRGSTAPKPGPPPKPLFSLGRER